MLKMRRNRSQPQIQGTTCDPEQSRAGVRREKQPQGGTHCPGTLGVAGRGSQLCVAAPHRVWEAELTSESKRKAQGRAWSRVWSRPGAGTRWAQTSPGTQDQ